MNGMKTWVEEKLRLEKLTFKENIYWADISGAAKVSYDDAAHDQLYEIEEKSFWFKHRNRIILEGVKQYPPFKNRIIDAGGGNGNTAYYLTQHGFKTAMFEPGARGCRNAAKRGMKHIVCSLLNTDSVKEKSIEAIGLFDVIEHLEDDRRLLNEFKDLLIDDGMLYITVPAYKILWSFNDDKDHFRRYDRKLLRAVVEESGYKVLYDTYFFWFLPALIFIFRTLPYKMSHGNKRAKKNDTGVKQKEFVAPAFVGKIIDLLLRGEIKRIQRRTRTGVGASLFLVARKF